MTDAADPEANPVLEPALDVVVDLRGRARERQEAGDGDAAVDLWLRAAGISQFEGDLAAARTDVDAALAAPHPEPSNARLAAFERAAQLATTAGDPAATSAWAEVAARAELVGDEERRCRALFHQYSVATDDAVGEEALRTAAAAGPAAGWALRARGQLAIRDGRMDDFADHLGAALHRARARGDLLLESVCLDGLSLVRDVAGRLDDALALQRRAVVLADLADEPWWSASLRYNLVLGLADALHTAAAVAELEALLTFCERRGLVTRRPFVRSALAGALLAAGRPGAALERAMSAPEEVAVLAAPERALALLTAADVRLACGLAGTETVELLDRAAAAAGVATEAYVAEERALRLRLALLQDDLDEAQRLAAAFVGLDDPRLVAGVALQAARAGRLLGHDGLRRVAAGLVPSISDVPTPFVRVAVTELRHDPPVLAVRRWREGGRPLDAALASACCVARPTGAGGRPDVHGLVHAHDELRSLGAAWEAELVSRRLPGRGGRVMAGGITGHPVLAGLGPADRERVTRRATVRAFRRGDVLAREGEPDQALQLVVEGAVRLRHQVLADRSITVGVLGAGEAVGVEALFGRAPTPPGADALSDGVVALVPLPAVRALMLEVPALGTALFGLVVDRLGRAERLFGERAYLSVDQRLARALLELADRFGVAEPTGGVRIGLTLTHTDLAEMIGATRKAVAVGMSALARGGLVHTSDRQFVLLDVEGLGDHADGGSVT